jgi:hypothetical protein
VVSDAPNAITWFNGAVGASPIIDTQGYNSIVISFGGAQGLYRFQTTNDPATFGTTANAVGWSALNAVQPVSSVTAVAGTVVVIPVTGRWFRLYCATAGTPALMTINLRAAPASMTTSTITVAGASAVGAAASTTPVQVAAVDPAGNVVNTRADANGYFSMGGPIRAGFQYGVYNALLGPATQVLQSATAAQSTFNPMPMGGLDQAGVVRQVLTDGNGAQVVRLPTGATAEPSLVELMQVLVAAGRAQTNLLSELVALTRGQTAVRQGEEGDQLIAEYLNPVNLTETIN